MRATPLTHLTPIYVAGVVAGHFARPLPVWPLVAGVVCLAAALLGRLGAGRSLALGGWRPRALDGLRLRLWRRPDLLLLGAAFFAGATMAAVAWQRLEPAPGIAEASRWAALEGRVASEPRPTESGYRFLLRTAGAGRYWRAGETIYVAVRREGAPASPGLAIEPLSGPPVAAAEPDSTPPATSVEPGDLVRVAGFLSMPRPPGNPGEFDFPLYLAASGVRYTLRAATDPSVTGAPRLAGFGSFCRRTRDRLMSAIDENLPADQASLLDGLLFGDTSRLPEDTARDFRRSGVYHILAVSGSNVAFIAGGFLLVARPALRVAGLRGPRAERVLWPATATVLAAYAVMSGLGPSVARATFMAEAGLVYLSLGRRRAVWGPICLATLVMLARQPLLVLDVGFQLSFAATLGILGVYPALWRWAGAGRLTRLAGRVPGFLRPAVTAVAQAAAVSLAAQAAVLPVLAARFGEVSLVGLLANLIVVPLSGLDVTIGLAAGAAHLGGPLGRLVATPLFWGTFALLRLTTGAAHALAGVPLASVIVGCPSAWVTGSYYLALLWVVRGAAVGKAGRRVVMAALLAGALAVGDLGAGVAGVAGGSGAAEVVFLDVGQGDAIFARLPGGRTVLVDGGPAGAGERVVGPFLRHRGAGRLDTVFVSHVHDDHVGGLIELLLDPGISVGEIVVARGVLCPETEASRPASVEALLDAAGARRVPVREVAAGDRLAGGRAGVVEVLWPPAEPRPAGTRDPQTTPEEAAAVSSRENDRSLVLRLRAGWLTLLLPGDLESTGEAALMNTAGAAVATLASTGLKVGHHGSPAASGLPFLSAVRPSFAIISVGTNSFGHPSPATETRLRQVNATVFETRPDGAVIVKVRGDGATLATFLSHRGFRLTRTAAADFTGP